MAKTASTKLPSDFASLGFASQEDYDKCMKDDECAKGARNKLLLKQEKARTSKLSREIGFSTTKSILWFIITIAFIGILGYILYLLFTSLQGFFQSIRDYSLTDVITTTTTTP